MTSFGDVMMALILVAFPSIAIASIFQHWFNLKEKKLEVEGKVAIEKAAQFAATNAELEARLRVLEKIVTDGGVQTAAQIEALRTPKQIEVGEPVR